MLQVSDDDQDLIWISGKEDGDKEMEWRGIYEVEGKRLDDQTDIGCQVGENPKISLSLGFGKVANICSENVW